MYGLLSQIEGGLVRRGGRTGGRFGRGALGAGGGDQGRRGRRAGGVAAGLRGRPAAGQEPAAAAGGPRGRISAEGQGAIALALRLLLSDAFLLGWADGPFSYSRTFSLYYMTPRTALMIMPHLLCV